MNDKGRSDPRPVAMDVELLPTSVLRRRQNMKWRKYGDAVLPAWVAEMDFGVAPPVQAAIERLVQVQDYGYAERAGGHVSLLAIQAFARRMQARFGWAVDPSLVQPIADLVQSSFATILAFSDPDDGIVLQVPAYPPFFDAIQSTGRRLIANPMRDDGTRYALDVEALTRSIDARTRMILFCHPQNPTGHVFDRAELEALGQLAIKHDLIIVSDEIHADLVYAGRRHLPLAMMSPAIAERTVTMTSATKGFNIPGLRFGVMHFGSAALRERFHRRIPAKLLGTPGVTGIDATTAAWEQCQPWLDDVVVRLQAGRDRLVQRLRAEMPKARFYAPEATYLAWIDFSALNLPDTPYRFFLDRAGVALSPGESFGSDYRAYGRLNFATAPEILDQIIDRMVAAVRAAGR